MTDEAPAKPGWSASPGAKAAMVLGLLLLMQIPLFTVSGLIQERQSRLDDVLKDFRRSWGPVQTVAAPVLAVPYEPEDKSKGRSWITIPASWVATEVNLVPERHRRGLFHAVVYRASLKVTGTIAIPRINTVPPLSAEPLWREAVLIITATDLRGQPVGATAEVNGVTAKLAFNAINGRCGGTAVVPVGLNGAAAVGTSIPFRAGLVLRGTQAINLLPNAQQFYLQMSGSWQTPSFTGATLPELFEVNKDGFRATWQIPGDASSGSWQIGANLPCITQANMEPSVGVELQEAMPTYQMVNRAAKYGTLFLALSFGTYFAFEAVSKVRIHLAQYVMLGLSVSLFALLLIALAEPLGFMAGYALSTLAVIGQASLYTLSVVRSVRLAAVFAAILGTLFGLLYVILSLETFALLAGTVAVFAALSGIMIVTRKVEWGGPFTPQVPPTAR